MSYTTLHQFLETSAQTWPDRTAIVAASGAQITYSELDILSNSVRDHLVAAGVNPGDRVGIFLLKSIDTVAAILGILKSGAAYVPVDATAPISRGAYILQNCEVSAYFVESSSHDALADALVEYNIKPVAFEVSSPDDGSSIRACLNGSGAAKIVKSVHSEPDSIAYILYTSGSTGQPKGVVISQQNAICFVNWCSDILKPIPDDRFSSHAPFHFDLSILDIYTSLKHGASLSLVDESVAKRPAELANWIESRGITIWYSAPSILTMLTQHGELDKHDHSSIRIVCFAGEVFPVNHLRSLKKLWPEKRYLNLYGPTETNVCTWHEIPDSVPDDRIEPYPIGKVCAHLRGIIVDSDGRAVKDGTEGELCIAGPSVLQEYWNLEEQTKNAYLSNRTDDLWYRTGDKVRSNSEGDYVFCGRLDRMVKKRGYRVELGEIEAGLYQHEQLLEAAVVAIPDDEAGVIIRAHLSTANGGKLSIIKLKKFCSSKLPVYMIPDTFTFHDNLPKTSTDKVDYQKLKNLN